MADATDGVAVSQVGCALASQPLGSSRAAHRLPIGSWKHAPCVHAFLSSHVCEKPSLDPARTGAPEGTDDGRDRWSCVSPKTAPDVASLMSGLGPVSTSTNALQMSCARRRQSKGLGHRWRVMQWKIIYHAWHGPQSHASRRSGGVTRRKRWCGRISGSRSAHLSCINPMRPHKIFCGCSGVTRQGCRAVAESHRRRPEAKKALSQSTSDQRQGE